MYLPIGYIWVSQVVLVVKKSASPRDMGLIPGWEDPLEVGVTTHASITWRIPWTEEPGRPQSIGLKRVGDD